MKSWPPNPSSSHRLDSFQINGFHISLWRVASLFRECLCVVLDLVRSASVWLLRVSYWLRRGEGWVVNGVRAIICIPSSWVQCPVVHARHRSSGKVLCLSNCCSDCINFVQYVLENAVSVHYNNNSNNLVCIAPVYQRLQRHQNVLSSTGFQWSFLNSLPVTVTAFAIHSKACLFFGLD